MLNVGADAIRRDAVGGRKQEVIGVLGSKESEPAPPAEADGSARALREVGACADVVVEDVGRGERLQEELVVLRRPFGLRQVLQDACALHLVLLLGRRCFSAAAARCSMTSFP